jgi:predicted transport protein
MFLVEFLCIKFGLKLLLNINLVGDGDRRGKVKEVNNTGGN